ncbi:MAG: hypothetical protein H6567_05335 [Lewinellaceae bacterium]|nr:hypothetical protein [Lewinellaceae bacterium]
MKFNRLIIFLALISIINNSCIKTNSVIQTNTNNSQIDTIIISKLDLIKCDDSLNCEPNFDCYHTYFELFPRFNNEMRVQSNKLFDLDTMKQCILNIYLGNNSKSEFADESLYQYYLNVCKLSDYRNWKRVPYGGNLNNHLLSKWNSRKSFEICMKLISKNEHDSMGHGDCFNKSVNFINTIVLPKIKTIEGMDFWTYFDKHNHGDHGPADCYDSMYEALYPMLKKAWEEGKIVLKTDE